MISMHGYICMLNNHDQDYLTRDCGSSNRVIRYSISQASESHRLNKKVLVVVVVVVVVVLVAIAIVIHFPSQMSSKSNKNKVIPVGTTY
ncbi:unnamed protein product [Amoebophrya sp. A25]|nr:unnamed protein product [Amoebophrya sp. A25]|eukprot:GSA25T00006601001.1